jgi:Methylamine utilisation protein MauE
MTTVSSASAFLLALLFFVAGVTKLRTPTAIIQAARDMGAPSWVAPLLAPMEIGVSVMLVIRPRVGAIAAAGLLVTFTVLLRRVVRSGAKVSCGCFGSSSREPVTMVTVARNVALLLLTVPAVMAQPLTNLRAGHALFVALGLFLVGYLLLALFESRRSTGSLFPSIRAEA